MGGFDISALKAEWYLLPSFFSSEERQKFRKQSFDEMWKTVSLHTEAKKFSNVIKLVNIIRCIPNSNAAAESFLNAPRYCNKKEKQISFFYS